MWRLRKAANRQRFFCQQQATNARACPSGWLVHSGAKQTRSLRPCCHTTRTTSHWTEADASRLARKHTSNLYPPIHAEDGYCAPPPRVTHEEPAVSGPSGSKDPSCAALLTGAPPPMPPLESSAAPKDAANCFHLDAICSNHHPKVCCLSVRKIQAPPGREPKGHCGGIRGALQVEESQRMAEAGQRSCIQSWPQWVSTSSFPPSHDCPVGGEK